jgi:hypothetical protein
MDNLTPWQRTCSHEAVRMSLEAVKEWLPNASKMRSAGTGEEVSLTDELRTDLTVKINEALITLAALEPASFDIQDLFKAGHGEVVFNCLEFYGEYIHSMLTFIGQMYRLSFKERFGMLPEELEATVKQAAQEDAGTSQA